MRNVMVLLVGLVAPIPTSAGTIWSCDMDSAREVARFFVDGDVLRDLRGADLMRDFALNPRVISPLASDMDGFKIIQNNADALVALRIAARYEPDYPDWLHVQLILIDKHSGRFTQRSTFQKGAVGFAPQDDEGVCTQRER